MVSQITTGYPTDHNGRPYRRRRSRPILIVLAVLAALGVIAWSVALAGSEADATPTDCNVPTPASASATDSAPADAAPAPTSAEQPTSTVVDRDDMLKVAPAALSTFQVRVLNASTQRGAARSASGDLTAQGFTPASDSAYGDDPLYPNHDLNCVAQIRFGPAGQAAAAAVWLAIPCAQLVNDGRRGTDVDVALGEYYEAQEQSQDAQAALEALRSADPKNPQSGVDPGLVSAVHSQRC
ncbi:envelope integrity protein Cei [Gordonia sp. NPDC003950]